MKIRILFILIIAMISVSTSPIIARLLSNVSPISIAFWRMFIGGALLWIFSLFFKQKPLGKSNRIRTHIFGVLLGLHFFYFFNAVKMTTISNATFLGTLAPFFTLLIEMFWLKRKISKNIILCVLLILFGSGIIVIDDFNFSSNYTLGNIYAIICSLFLGIGFILSEGVRKNETTISFSRTLYMSAAATLFILSYFLGSSLIDFQPKDFIGLLILGIVPTLIGHNSLYYAIKYLSPTTIASVPLGEPIIASIIAYFIFDEFSGYQIIISGIIILSGLFYLTNQSREKEII